MGGMGGMHPGQQHGMGQQMMGMNAKHPQQVCVGEGVGVGVGMRFFLPGVVWWRRSSKTRACVRWFGSE